MPEPVESADSFCFFLAHLVLVQQGPLLSNQVTRHQEKVLTLFCQLGLGTLEKEEVFTCLQEKQLDITMLPNNISININTQRYLASIEERLIVYLILINALKQ